MSGEHDWKAIAYEIRVETVRHNLPRGYVAEGLTIIRIAKQDDSRNMLGGCRRDLLDSEMNDLCSLALVSPVSQYWSHSSADNLTYTH